MKYTGEYAPDECSECGEVDVEIVSDGGTHEDGSHDGYALCEACDEDTREHCGPEDYLDYDDGDYYDRRFADPGGRSALRAASADNPRNRPCPNCGREDALTPADVALGYQCDSCADALESGWAP